jgi:hypothetical protein
MGELALAVAGAGADEVRCPVAVLVSLLLSSHAEHSSAQSTIAPAIFMGTQFFAGSVAVNAV